MRLAKAMGDRQVNLAKRILVAAWGVPLICFLVWLGSWYFLVFVEILVILGAGEFYSIAREKGLKPLAGPGIILAAVLPVIFFLGLITSYNILLSTGLALTAVLFAGSFILGDRLIEDAIARISVSVFGIVYVGGLFSLQLVLRHDPQFSDIEGFSWLILAYLVTWSVDVGSFAVGRLIGRHKLCPSLSPGKTIEGAVGGLLFGIAASSLAGAWWLKLFDNPAAMLFGTIITAAAVLGDLVESVFKRDAQVKDSSNFLPGHGGVLDRFDSILFTVPVTVIFRSFVY